MERHVKERLVGAAVLMAAAIILIPEMLSGPDRVERPEQVAERATSETGLKTYSIDLNNPPGTSSPQSVPDERAPPPEVTPPVEQPAGSPIATSSSASEDESNPEPAPRSSPTLPPSSESMARAAGAARETQAPRDSTASEQTAAPKAVESQVSRAPLASAASVPTSRGWAVQLGSFSSQASAERLAGEFRAGRDNVFVMPVKSGATTLYRVRIGPMQERAAAEETLRRVKTKVSGAAVVAHP